MRYDEDYPEIIENCIRARENLEHFYDYPIEVYHNFTLSIESIANNSNSDYFFSEDREINEINLLYILIGNNSIMMKRHFFNYIILKTEKFLEDIIVLCLKEIED